MSGRRTKGTDSGLLLTPLVIDASLSKSLRDGYQRNHSFGSLSEQMISAHGLRLTARLAEKVMGWPLEWTDLKPLVTVKSLFVPPQPIECLFHSLEMSE